MSDDVIISVRNLKKTYKLYNRPIDRVKEAFHPFRKKYHHTFDAVRDVSFDVRRGEVLGVIGVNGSGKSTLLQILCGILSPSGGEVEVKGRIAALLELGAGFNPEFTGRENVYLNGAILGFREEEIDDRFDEIANFADIGEFIDQPVKVYSSGMFVRLAFAVQACLEPDVLIVDEALSVGDIFFVQKCHARMEALLAQSTAIVIVSHDMSAIERYSTHTLLMDEGRPHFLGQPNEAVQRYYLLNETCRVRKAECNDKNVTGPSTYKKHSDSFEPGLLDWPDDEAFIDLSRAVFIGRKEVTRCTGIALCDDRGKPCKDFKIGEVACFYYEFEVLEDINVPLGGVELTNRMNITVHAKNSLQHFAKAPTFVQRGSRIRFRQTMELSIAPEDYTFTVAFATMDAEFYQRAKDVDYRLLHSKIHTLLRVRGIGSIAVRRGLSLPFYGVTNLRGDCVLATVK